MPGIRMTVTHLGQTGDKRYQCTVDGKADGIAPVTRTASGPTSAAAERAATKLVVAEVRRRLDAKAKKDKKT